MNVETYGEALRNARGLLQALSNVDESIDGRLALLVAESHLGQLEDRMALLRRQLDAALR